MDDLSTVIKEVQSEEIEGIQNGYHVRKITPELSTFKFTAEVTSLIWPSREGEMIENIGNLPTHFSYSLSYPGTASTKSIVLFARPDMGIFIGGKPTDNYCKLRIKRIGENKVEISFESTEHDFVTIPFKANWKDAVVQYKEFYGIIDGENIETKPKLLLQIGAIAPECTPKFKDFNDLRIVVDKFHDAFGEGNIVHLFGTDSAGFDRMFPRFNMSADVGGEEKVREFLEYVHDKNLLTSHHFIPRIADYDWVMQNPEFKECVITGVNHENVGVVELYKGHPFYVMNINHPRWFDKCLETIERIHGLGFDYVQLDQFSYQRTFFDKSAPLANGYKRLIEAVEKKGINYWLEGVNDIYHPKGMNFGQILVRNTPNLWDDFEQRRGYPFGRSYPEFYTSIYPNDNYSYQIVTENKSLENTIENLNVAKSIKAKVYDLQMDYYGESYMELLTKTIELLNSLK